LEAPEPILRIAAHPNKPSYIVAVPPRKLEKLNLRKALRKVVILESLEKSQRKQTLTRKRTQR